MALFDYFKMIFGRDKSSPYFSAVNLLCGACSGVIACCTIFPIVTVRIRIQAMGKTSYAENYEGIYD